MNVFFDDFEVSSDDIVLAPEFKKADRCDVRFSDGISLSTDAERAELLDSFAKFVSANCSLDVYEKKLSSYNNSPLPEDFHFKSAMVSFEPTDDSCAFESSHVYVALVNDGSSDRLIMGLMGPTETVRHDMPLLADVRSQFNQTISDRLEQPSVMTYDGLMFSGELEDSVGNYFEYEPVRCFDTLLQEHHDYLYEVFDKAKGTEYEQILRRDCDLIDSVMNGFDMSLLTRPSSAELNDTPPLEEDVHGLSHVR